MSDRRELKNSREADPYDPVDPRAPTVIYWKSSEYEQTSSQTTIRCEGHAHRDMRPSAQRRSLACRTDIDVYCHTLGNLRKHRRSGGYPSFSEGHAYMVTQIICPTRLRFLKLRHLGEMSRNEHGPLRAYGLARTFRR